MRRADRPEVSLVLFTDDLRVHDNPALHAAVRGSGRVVPLFVRDETLAATGFATPNRTAFLADCLADLDAALQARGGRLVRRHGRSAEECARLAEATGASAVHVAAGVTRYARQREADLREAFGDALHVHDTASTVVAPGAVTPAARDHYAVFTPYLRAWEREALPAPLPAPPTVLLPDRLPDRNDDELPYTAPDSPALPAGGETEARRLWRRALRTGALDGYADAHDDLAADGTTRLSPFLHFGCVSPRTLVHDARRNGGPGADAFVRQLAWRDFHRQVLAARPQAARDDYRPRGDRWTRDHRELRAWQDGRTGYPLVDAGMRQLRHEGWMHNRARLLTASFLAKTLYHDWREGAAHFLRYLVDGDVANNQLNWQWAAGTGTDTRPNRILNPLTQAKRLDPDGAYIRRWVPELAHLKAPDVHRPWTLAPRDRGGYPDPLVPPDALAARFTAGRG